MEKALTKRELAIQKEKERKKKIKKTLAIALPVAIATLAILITGLVLFFTRDTAPIAKITVKEYGVITVRLDKENAPKTVERFMKLANDGFYNGVPFYRLTDGMLYSGDPEGNGQGGYTSSIYGEFLQNGLVNNLSHKKGVISLDRDNDFNSGTSRFFILTKDHTELDGSYAAFGTVKKGLDILEKIASDVTTNEMGQIPEASQPMIESIVIELP